MPNELFNNTLKTELDNTDRIAIGIPGMTGANNIKVEDFLKQASGWNILTGSIINESLVDGTWTLEHNKNTMTIRMSLKNPAGYEQNLGGILKVVDADTIQIEFGGAIDEGTWDYIFEYFLT